MSLAHLLLIAAGDEPVPAPDEAAMRQLLQCGARRADAEAALQHTGGDVPAAKLFWTDCLAQGSSAAACMTRSK